MEDRPDPRLVREVNLLLEEFEAHCRRRGAPEVSCPEPFLERDGRSYCLGYGEALSHRGLVAHLVGPKGEAAEPLCDMGTDVRLAAVRHLEPLLRRIGEEERPAASPELEDRRRTEEERLIERIRSLCERIAGSAPPA